MLTHGELFAGIGGFGEGFSRAGIVTKWCVEIDENCQSILRRHNPKIPILGDIRECGAHNLTPVDIISFGSPCQDLSVAGKREGLDGARSGLFYEAIRIVDVLKPTFAVWENVPGALSSNSGRDFAAVLAAFRDIGARDIAWTCLDAQYFGVPQRRRRIFLVADFGGERAAEILFEPSRSAWNPPPSRETGQRVAGTLAGSSHRPGCKRDDERGLVTDPLAQSPYADNEAQHRKPVVACSEVSRALTACKTATGRLDPNEQEFVAYGVSENQRAEVLLTDYSHQITSGGGKPGQGYPCVAFNWQSGGDVRLGISSEHTSALHASQTPAVRQAFGVRRLTPTECERLQGFPDGWTLAMKDRKFGKKNIPEDEREYLRKQFVSIYGRDFKDEDEFRILMSDTQRYRQMGNAVAVPVIRWIGERIMQIDSFIVEE